jgi:L-threonylcarbamoyladenylate synthase
MHWVSRFRLRLARRHIRRGGVLAYPTETVFGLGCDPLNPQAVARLLVLKGRDVGKGLILIAGEFNQLSAFLAPLDPAMERKVLGTWPGPVTWLMPARNTVPRWLTGSHDSIAVRVTAHPGCRELCRVVGGPLVSTSANPSGSAPAKTPLQVRRYFRDCTLAFLPGRLGEQGKPSAIFDAVSGARLR